MPLDTLTDLVDDQQRIVETRPLIVHETHTATGRTMTEALDLFLQDYLESLPADRRQLLARYQIVDALARWWGWGVWARLAGSSSCAAWMTAIRSSCR
jgi:Uncharacterized protein conserved in bacteria (DUF2252)